MTMLPRGTIIRNKKRDTLYRIKGYTFDCDTDEVKYRYEPVNHDGGIRCDCDEYSTGEARMQEKFDVVHGRAITTFYSCAKCKREWRTLDQDPYAILLCRICYGTPRP